MFTYFSEHPNVFMSDSKETLYWASDFPSAQKQVPARLDSLNDYLRLFSQRTPQQIIVGEATACYLRSALAIRRILDYNPDSRFLVMLRNGIDFVVSYHNELLYSRKEDVTNFDTAWDLKHERIRGYRIPASCCQPEFLQYQSVASFGSQISALKKLASPDQYKIVLLEDFIADPRKTYLSLSDFLGLPDDGRSSFPPVNERKAPRFHFLNALYYTKRPLTRRIVHSVRSRAKHVAPLRMLSGIVRSKPRPRTELSDSMRHKLVLAFRDDIQLLSTLLERDLDHWIEPSVEVNAPRA